MVIVWVILGALVFYWAETHFYEKYWNRNLDVTLSFSEESVMQGEKCYLSELVENRKWLPLIMLKVKFQMSRNLRFPDDDGSSVTDQFYRNDVLTVFSWQRVTRKLEFVCKKRGYYQVNGIDLVGGDLFFSKEMNESRSSNIFLYVYPKPSEIPGFLSALQKLNGEVLTKRHLLEDPFEYRGIREYMPGDEMKSINWKASARSGDLRVNQKNYTALKTVRLFINLEDGGIWRREELLEESISMAAGCALFFLQQGIQISLYSNGCDRISGNKSVVRASAGSGQMETVNRMLARIDLSKKAQDFEKVMKEDVLSGERDVYTIFISASASDGFQELLGECRKEHMDVAWIAPLYPDMEVKVRPELMENFYRIPIEKQ